MKKNKKQQEKCVRVFVFRQMDTYNLRDKRIGQGNAGPTQTSTTSTAAEAARVVEILSQKPPPGPIVETIKRELGYRNPTMNYIQSVQHNNSATDRKHARENNYASRAVHLV